AQSERGDDGQANAWQRAGDTSPGRGGRFHSRHHNRLMELRDRLFLHAREQGWAAVGVADLRPFETARERALAAIDAGRMDGMSWFSRERVDASSDLRRRYPWARSLLSLAWPYRPAMPLRGGRLPEPPPGEEGR